MVGISPSLSVATLPFDDLCLVDSICDRFEEEFCVDAPPCIRAAIDSVGTRLQRFVFRELLWRAFELYARSGSPRTLHDICRPYPDLVANFGDVLLELRHALPDYCADAGLSTVPVEAPFDIPGYAWRGFIGRGAFAGVWRAFDETLQRVVAVKIPREHSLTDRDAIQRFRREARIIASLSHPGIVDVHHAELDVDHPYFVMDYVENGSFEELLRLNRPSERDGAGLMIEVAEAVQCAHDHGIIHRDLKPSNILISSSKKPLVADFGLARLESSSLTATVAGQIIGTPAYMSPEQASGENATIGATSDVYALGAIFYEFLTGVRAFQGELPIVLNNIREGRKKWPRDIDSSVDRQLEAICMKAMSLSPRRRYQSPREMAADLAAVNSNSRPSVRPLGVMSRAREELGRRRALATIAATFAGTGILGWMFYPGAKSHSPTARRINLTTNPAGAEVVFFRLGFDGHLETKIDAGISPIDVWLEPGEYFVVAQKSAELFHEVYRYVPSLGEVNPRIRAHQFFSIRDEFIELPMVKLFPQAQVTRDLVYFEGSDSFVVGDDELPEAPPHDYHLPPFYLQTTEVTIGDFRKHWRSNIPKLLRNGAQSDELPMTHIDFDTATAYAERMGMRLQTEFEYEFAATNAGRTKFPWGNDDDDVQSWTYHEVSDTFDQLQPDAKANRLGGVFGLYSNVLEWTSSAATSYPKTAAHTDPTRIIVRGGPALKDGKPIESLWFLGPRQRIATSRRLMSGGVGLRCARSAAPRMMLTDHPHFKA